MKHHELMASLQTFKKNVVILLVAFVRCSNGHLKLFQVLRDRLNGSLGVAEGS